MEDSEIRPGLYPKPPVLAKRLESDPSRDFWIIKHGIKMSGMPAWGYTHDDDTIWAIVAFLQKLPKLSSAEYQTLTAETNERGAQTD
jgi:mono/diheme cytochrome c family protein